MPIPSTMLAPRFLGKGRIELAERPVPEPGPGQLLLRVRANALCGSERGQFLGGADVVPGHEAAGTVAAAGPGTATPVGTPGVVFLMAFCGACRSCRRGATNQCLAKRGDYGFNRDGGYAPYELVDERVFFPVDPELPLDEATMLLDIMGTGGHAIGRARLVHQDIESVLVMGAGPIGLAVLAMCCILLPGVPVLIADVTPYRLELARALGGTPLDAAAPLGEQLRAHGLHGADVAFDTSGREVARRAALDALAQRGALVCVGHGEGLALRVSPDLIAAERAVLGSEYFRFDELPANLALIRQHRAALAPIITHRMPLARIQEAFELFFSGQSGKVVVEP